MKRLSMSAESMRAILAGRKSLTTRVVVPQPDEMGTKWAWSYHRRSIYGDAAEMAKFMAQHAPYHAGERVALTEPWSPWADEATKQAARESMFDDPLPVGPVVYASDFAPGCPPLDVGGCERWRSARYMPAEFSRQIVTITSVSAGRLWDMTYRDFVREGYAEPVDTRESLTGDELRAKLKAADDWYMEWWRRLNGERYPWETNPWVWHDGFEREVKL